MDSEEAIGSDLSAKPNAGRLHCSPSSHSLRAVLQ
jgi:hypothetical protein